ncbi:hypothetical protein GCM10007907_11830 [Chitinimonas prasina]|uniref:Nicotinamide riboside transporter PnuC n=1 Tax=Chitinimonas prasina TaxID=1434937 RepID=A0ABQ5YEH9_9NEIS|nr:hypothetical protein [Chitinimonas prasina]GLR12393.1 hypothetical protein GCM10007907_11830 [Chitinimonas prasina]
MSPFHGLDWLAMALTFTALYLVGNRQRNGFLLMMLGNLVWGVISVWMRSPAMLIANAGFLLMNARNYRSWSN